MRHPVLLHLLWRIRPLCPEVQRNPIIDEIIGKDPGNAPEVPDHAGAAGELLFPYRTLRLNVSYFCTLSVRRTIVRKMQEMVRDD